MNIYKITGPVEVPYYIIVNYFFVIRFMNDLKRDLMNNSFGLEHKNKDFIFLIPIFLSLIFLNPVFHILSIKNFLILIVFLVLITTNSYFGVSYILEKIDNQNYVFSKCLNNLNNSKVNLLDFYRKFDMFMNKYYIFKNNLMNFYFYVSLYEIILAYIPCYMMHLMFDNNWIYVCLVWLTYPIVTNFYEKKFKSNEYKMLIDNINVINNDISNFF